MAGYKTFLIRSFLFGLPVVLALTAYTCYYYIGGRYQDSVNGREIYGAIKKSAKHKKVKKLLIGDSVAQQLFDNRKYNDSTYSLTCNQAISCAGYYFLLKSFLDKNPDSLPARVILVVHPLSLQNNLNQVYTYHYFLKPFYCQPYRQYFTATVYNQIQKIRFYYLSQFPFIKISNWSPDFRPEKVDSTVFLSPISLEYLYRIKSLCDSLHIPFAMVAPPISLVYKPYLMQNSARILHESESINMQAYFAPYLSSFSYCDNALYKDEMHFIKPDNVDVSFIDTLSFPGSR
jgi:hypothetical protein